MVLIDLNIWLYAYNTSEKQQQAAQSWIESVLISGESVIVPWSVIVGFARLIGLGPLRFNLEVLDQTLSNFFSALSQDNVTVINPSQNFLEVYQKIVITCQSYGNLAPDAYLAALAIENGARLATNDKGFSRFESEGLRWFNPLVQEHLRKKSKKR